MVNFWRKFEMNFPLKRLSKENFKTCFISFVLKIVIPGINKQRSEQKMGAGNGVRKAKEWNEIQKEKGAKKRGRSKKKRE